MTMFRLADHITAFLSTLGTFILGNELLLNFLYLPKRDQVGTQAENRAGVPCPGEDQVIQAPQTGRYQKDTHLEHQVSLTK